MLRGREGYSNMDSEYYNGYLLDGVQTWELSTEEKCLLDACIWMVDNNATIRCTASNSGLSKTTLHRHIHTKLKSISFELYKCVKSTLKYNQFHRR